MKPRRHPRPPEAGEVDNVTVHPYRPDPVRPDPGEPTDPMHLVATLFARQLDQVRELAELRRHPQPVWVHPSDRVTTPAGALVAAGPPVRIAERQLDRIRITLINTGNGTLFLLGRDPVAVGTVNGFPLGAGAAITIDTRGAISAFSPSGTTWAALVELTEPAP